jgi:hypothetical protein
MGVFWSWAWDTAYVELSFLRPELTFACELDPARLAALFADSSVIEDLLALSARVALMVSDFSDERAGVVQQLSAAGIPVVGIPLLPLAQGYYFTADNAAEAAGRYQEWQEWTSRHGLTWQGWGWTSNLMRASTSKSWIIRGAWCRCWFPGYSTGPARNGRGQRTRAGRPDPRRRVDGGELPVPADR